MLDKSEEMKRIKRVIPTQYVVYVPNGIDRLFVEWIFDLSPRALFHLIFGNRGTVRKLLHQEHHAQQTFTLLHHIVLIVISFQASNRVHGIDQKKVISDGNPSIKSSPLICSTSDVIYFSALLCSTTLANTGSNLWMLSYLLLR